MLHKLFLCRLAQFLFIVEECLQRRVIPNLPCMFVRGTDFKVRFRVLTAFFSGRRCRS